MENINIPVDLVAPLFSPATFKNMDMVNGILATLRRDYPLSLAEVPGYDPYWIVTKYEDIREVSRQDEFFANGEKTRTLASQLAVQMMRDYVQKR